MSYHARRRAQSHLAAWKWPLDAAYRATRYCAGEFVVQIGRRHGDLDAYLARCGCRSWAYLTAANPRSQCLGEAENKARMADLQGRLTALGHSFLSGASVAAAPALHGDWPPEPGLLVLGIGRRQACALAAAFAQNALVLGRRGGRAKLLWLCF